MSTRKAVIPAAGLGTRFMPAAKAQPKEMTTVVDRPAIQYVVEEAARAGLTDVLVVTGRGKQSLEDHFDRSPELEERLERTGKKEILEQVQAPAELAAVHFVRQGEPRGLGHAVGMARHHVGWEPFAVLLPDDLMAESSNLMAELLAVHQEWGLSVVALKEVGDTEIPAYGAVSFEPVQNRPTGKSVVRLLDVVEKPSPGSQPSNLAIMGRYVFTPSVFDALAQVGPGQGGEIQLTDAMTTLARGEGMLGYVFEEGRFDIGDKLGYLKATVELALGRDDLGPPFRAFLADLARRERLC